MTDEEAQAEPVPEAVACAPAERRVGAWTRRRDPDWGLCWTREDPAADMTALVHLNLQGTGWELRITKTTMTREGERLEARLEAVIVVPFAKPADARAAAGRSWPALRRALNALNRRKTP